MNTRVVINGRFVGQPITGVQRYALEITRRLLEMRSDVIVATPRLNGPHAPTFPVNEVGRLRGHVWEQVELPLFLARHGSPLLLSLANIGPSLYRRQVATHHEVAYVRHPESYSRRFKLLYSLLVPRYLRNSRVILTSSEFGKEEICSHYRIDPRKAHVVYGAADSIFRPRENDQLEGRYFLTVASPSAHKNLKRLVDAFKQSQVEARLVLVGSSAPSLVATDLEEADARVHAMGRVTDAQLGELYQGAYAFILPSFYEGFGLPPIEAQRCGCPVLAARAGSLPEVLGDSALFFDPSSTEDMSRAIREVTGDPSLRETLARSGLGNSRRFDWDESAVAVSRLIDKALDGRGQDGL